MKALPFIAALLLSGMLAAQTTLIVDNNFNAPTGPNIYSTLSAAVAAANPGDTIQVQPSPTTYGSVGIDKRLVLVGIGFNVVKDIPMISKITDITLYENADGTQNASGTIITGLDIRYIYPAAPRATSYTLDSVTIYNCQFDYMSTNSSYRPINAMEVYDCYVTSATYNAGFYFASPVTNSIFRNNLNAFGYYFNSSTPGTNTIANNIIYGKITVTAEGTNTNIINNIFVGATASSNAFYSVLRDCIVSYNIFYGPTPSVAATGTTSTNFQRNVFSFNIVHAAGDTTMAPTGGGSGNSGSPNYVVNPQFSSVLLQSTWSAGNDYTLDPTSPALFSNIPSGDNPITDIGITGGLYPWNEANFSLQTTALPVIEVLNTATIINPGDSLAVRVKVKSN